jgi:uncharacterized protein YeaO (DUF488 family)
MMPLKLKRAYEHPSRGDGVRVLVDRIWPRGVTKDMAKVDHWLKELAPSTALRKWFGHIPSRWAEFKHRYFAELDSRCAAIDDLRKIASGRTVTLVFGARDVEHNQAAALKMYLETRRRRLGA